MSGLFRRLRATAKTTKVPSGQYKLGERDFHHTQVIGDALYLWGGESDDLPDVHNSEEKKKVTSHVQVFDMTTGKWNNQSTRGSPPLGVTGYFCTTVEDKIYYFGGYCGHDECFHNSLHELNISTLTWTQLQSTTDSIAVMKRGFGGMMSNKLGGITGQYSLLIVGGYGVTTSTYHPRAQYYQLPSARVRTNEHNLYDLTTGQWIIPEIVGRCMPPNSGFVMESINNRRAFIFGGVVREKPFDYLYCLDIINHTVHWQTIAKPGLVVQWPEKRWGHAASIITGSISSKLVMTGGMDNDYKTLKDCWILDINEKSWTKINLPDSISERCNHSLSTFFMGQHSVWLIAVGGGVNPGTPVTDPNVTILAEIVLNGSQWSVGLVLDSNDLTSTDKYQQRALKQLIEGRRECHIEQDEKQNIKQEDKELQYIIESLQDELKETRDHYHQQLQQRQQAQHQLQESQDEIQQTKDQYQRQLQQKQQWVQELEHQLQESQDEIQQTKDQYQRQLQQKQQWVQELEHQLQESQDEIQQTKDQSQQQLQQKQQWVQELEHQLQESQDEIQKTRQSRDQYQQSNLSLLQKLQQTEQAQQDIEQQLEKLRSLQAQPHWVVDRDEVIMTQEVLGKGSYGKVKVAVFRGLRVAAKSLHGIIISEYTRDLFSREMDIASRVRHPNLVQFIGATTVGIPIILMEMMATSLYNELQKKPLTQSQILGISCDVASALNYLHLWKPDPIIHRDISSPNVLLEPSVGDSFKAKVTDYGAANLQQQAKTDMPGNPAYASPESRYPDDHSPAMDVYSYSVLLMEMILCCPPAMTVPKREEQASLISWPPMSSLIQRCLNRDHHCRPTMIQILDQLKELNV